MNEKIEELRAKRLEIEARREADKLANADAEELARETRALADAEAIDAAEKEHGADGIRIVQTEEGVIIVKRPAQATYRKFIDTGKGDTESLDKLAAPCLVYPAKLEYRRLLDKYPHTVVACANAVCALAGAKPSEKG